MPSSSFTLVMWTSICWVLACVLMVNSQMTFSDGWGKRSVMLKEVHHRSAGPEATFTENGESQIEADKAIVNAALDVCHTAYSQSLVQLHQQIMTMYESYQKCQDRAVLSRSNLRN
uniref:Uncharacterized protein n=1 Tax=Ditylenchus dipsaci TaxID=166011 RepID=A0A915ETG8_9BILA